MEQWVSKVALVTDADFGFGRNIIESLVENGVIVVGTAYPIERLEQYSKNLSNKKGKLIPLKFDLYLSSTKEFSEVFKWVEDNVGPIQIFIGNIGHCGRYFLSEARGEYNGKAKNLYEGINMAVQAIKKNEMGYIIHINILSKMFYSQSDHARVPRQHDKLNELMFDLEGELNKLGSKILVASVGDPNAPYVVAGEVQELSKKGQLSEEIVHILSVFPSPTIYHPLVHPSASTMN